MLTTFEHLAELSAYDVCIVGAGPIGLAAALSCEKAGLSVLVLESGHKAPEAFSVSLSAGHVVDSAQHADPGVAICRVLGGASRWWGGRCVPFDDVDFAERPQVPEARWPFGHQDVSRYYQDAADFFGIGEACFARAPEITPRLEEVSLDRLERWTPEIDMARRHRRHIEDSKRLAVALGATVVDLVFDKQERRIEAFVVASAKGRVTLPVRRGVLACGGLETPRLLLAVQKRHPAAFGGEDGPLGRGYMGHLSGKIANIILDNPSAVSDHDFFLDGGVFVRRRFQLTEATQKREGVLNTAFWADNPIFYDPEHRNGTLSLVWLTLAIPFAGRLLLSEGVRLAHVGPKPWKWGRHILNVIETPLATLSSILGIMYGRFVARPPKPGFLIRNKGGRYALHFHAEQAPDAESRVTLTDKADPLAMPYLDVRLRFSPGDAESVVRSHEILDQALRRAGVGRLEYHQASREARIASVLEQATDGFHQAGTTRMSSSSADGVVDAQCRVHGLDNLWIAGCSVLPSSGQANPTFVAAALAVRLARQIADAESAR